MYKGDQNRYASQSKIRSADGANNQNQVDPNLPVHGDQIIQYVPYPVPMQSMMGYIPPYGNPSSFGGEQGNMNQNMPIHQQMQMPMGYPYPHPMMMQQPVYGQRQQAASQPFNFSGQYFYKQGQEKEKNNEYNQKEQRNKQNKESHLAALKTKSPQQIVNEFKAYTLPKLRLKRLIKLQALMRAYYTRKFIIPRRKITLNIFSNYVDKLVRNYIEDKIVPDIVLEVLAYNKYNEDVNLYSTEYRAHLEVMDRILLRVVRETCETVVKESTDNLVTGILRQRDQNKPAEERDPMVLVVRDVIVNTIKDDCLIIANECIKEMTYEYMEDIHIRNLIREKYVTKAVKEVVIDAIQEIAIEELLEDLILRNTQQLALPLAQHMFDLVQQEMEGVQLDKALDNYILRGMIDIILEQANVVIDNNNKALQDIYKTLQQSNQPPNNQNN